MLWLQVWCQNIFLEPALESFPAEVVYFTANGIKFQLQKENECQSVK